MLRRVLCLSLLLSVLTLSPRLSQAQDGRIAAYDLFCRGSSHATLNLFLQFADDAQQELWNFCTPNGRASVPWDPTPWSRGPVAFVTAVLYTDHNTCVYVTAVPFTERLTCQSDPENPAAQVQLFFSIAQP